MPREAAGNALDIREHAVAALPVEAVQRGLKETVIAGAGTHLRSGGEGQAGIPIGVRALSVLLTGAPSVGCIEMVRVYRLGTDLEPLQVEGPPLAPCNPRGANRMSVTMADEKAETRAERLKAALRANCAGARRRNAAVPKASVPIRRRHRRRGGTTRRRTDED